MKLPQIRLKNEKNELESKEELKIEKKVKIEKEEVKVEKEVKIEVDFKEPKFENNIDKMINYLKKEGLINKNCSNWDKTVINAYKGLYFKKFGVLPSLNYPTDIDIKKII